MGLGLTAKIRDAGISLEGNNIKSKKTNIGFVPLINFQAQLLLTEGLNLILAGDALAAPQGRVEDIFIGVSYRLSNLYNLFNNHDLYKLSNNLNLKLGYRFLEGGADVEEVYNFAWLNYGVIGFILKI
ncbi:MAG: hypothetical protein ABIK61_01225 [candidate division WOR-3 bacterium]